MNKNPRKKSPSHPPFAAAEFTLKPAPGPVRPVVLLAGVMVVVALVVLATHWPALSAEALCFDDTQYMTENPLVQNPSWRSAKRFLSEVLEPSTVGGYYQPLTMISLMLDYAVAGRPGYLRPFHRTSLALHVLNTSLVIVLLYMLWGQPWVAGMVGLLFGVHPMTVEAIPWVGERKTLLASFFALWSLILYVRFARTSRWGWYASCLVAYVLALMSKPTSTPLPVVFLLLDYWPLRRLSRRAVLEKIPLIAIGCISAVVTFISQANTAAVEVPGTRSLSRIVLTLCHNIIFYLVKIVWPTNLTSHYAFPKPFDLSNPVLVIYVVGTCLLVAALLISPRWTRSILTGWLIFFVAIFPTMGVIGFTVVIASDKFAYLPSIGIMLTLAYLLTGWWNVPTPASRARVRRSVLWAVVVVLAVMEFFATRGYLKLWRDSETLYQHMLTLAPNSAVVHNGLGVVLSAAGRNDEAIEHYDEALRHEPDYVRARYNLATVLYQQGKADAALEHYARVVKTWPTCYKACSNMGAILLDCGKVDEAVERCAQSLQYAPHYLQAHVNMGRALARKGRAGEAIEHYRQALAIDPNHALAHYNLANTLYGQRRLDEAIKHYGIVLRIDPKFAKVYTNFGNALLDKGEITQAVDVLTRGQAVEPGNYKLLNSLAGAWLRQGRVDEAIECYRKALKIEPHLSAIYVNLAAALVQKGRLDEATEAYRTASRLEPTNTEWLCTLGNLLAKQDKLDEAIESYRRALRIDPTNKRAKEGLADSPAKKNP